MARLALARINATAGSTRPAAIAMLRPLPTRLLVLLARQSTANLTQSSEELASLDAISQQQRHEIYALAINAKQAIAQNANLRLLMETFLQDCTTFFQTSHD